MVLLPILILANRYSFSDQFALCLVDIVLQFFNVPPSHRAFGSKTSKDALSQRSSSSCVARSIVGNVEWKSFLLTVVTGISPENKTRRYCCSIVILFIRFSFSLSLSLKHTSYFHAALLSKIALYVVWFCPHAKELLPLMLPFSEEVFASVIAE